MTRRRDRKTNRPLPYAGERRIALLTVAVVAMLLAAVRRPLGAAPPSRARRMALTFDDLPYAEVPPTGPNVLGEAERVTEAILRTLGAHHAPSAAFVNEGKLGAEPESAPRVAFLRRWIDAGAILGNHTYSHADFNDLTVPRFENEILRGEVVTRRLMRPREPYPLFFRFPRTHTGDTREKKEALEQFLRQRGYAIAPHTIDSSDFVFNRGYVHALRGNEALGARLRKDYPDFVIRATESAERIAQRIFGRPIPQVILFHANDINADCLDDLLKRFESRGYAFISLDAAMADPAYRTPDTLVTPFGPTWLWRWAKSRGMSVSFRDDPEPSRWVVELSETTSR